MMSVPRSVSYFIKTVAFLLLISDLSLEIFLRMTAITKVFGGGGGGGAPTH